MGKILTYLSDIFSSKSIRNKILFTLFILVLYRILIHIPVPFVHLQQLMSLESGSNTSGGLSFLSMLFGGSIKNFSIIAVGLVPFINASIIIQLLTAVIPQLEELQEQGESGTMKIQQYTRWLTFPLGFLQSIGMVYFMNYISGGSVIDTGSKAVLLLSAFVLTIGTVMLLWLGEMITEKGITNGVSLIIFASIVSGISSQIFTLSISSNDLIGIILFMIIIVGVLVVLSVLLVKTRKEIPIVYARGGKVEQTAELPIPLNPVGMIPIIFAIAFTSFPYLLSQIMTKVQISNTFLTKAASWIESNFNIYTNSPSLIVIAFYFVLIVMFTFFYAMIQFNPEKIADNIQRRGGFIPGIRPGEETAKYISGMIKHLCLWGGAGLGFIGIYSYILSYLPFVKDAAVSLGSIPVVVTGSGVVIIVGVVQDLLNKINADLLMEGYEKI